MKTGFVTRYADAVQALCKGHRPRDEIVEAWLLDESGNELRLQDFAGYHGVEWMQGIAILDAAFALATTPTEGDSHETFEEFLESRGLTVVGEDTKPPMAESAVDLVRDAIAEALGDAYDCNRQWSAWSYGTMGPDDFSMVREDSDRVDEIAQAAVSSLFGCQDLRVFLDASVALGLVLGGVVAVDLRTKYFSSL